MVLHLLIGSNAVSVVCGFIVCVQDLMVMVTAVLTCQICDPLYTNAVKTV